MRFSSSRTTENGTSTNSQRVPQLNTYIPLPFSGFSGRRCPTDVLIFADYSFTNKPSIFTPISFDSAYNLLLLRDPSDCFYSNLDVVAFWHSALKFHVDWFQISFDDNKTHTHMYTERKSDGKKRTGFDHRDEHLVTRIEISIWSSIACELDWYCKRCTHCSWANSLCRYSPWRLQWDPLGRRYRFLYRRTNESLWINKGCSLLTLWLHFSNSAPPNPMLWHWTNLLVVYWHCCQHGIIHCICQVTPNVRHERSSFFVRKYLGRDTYFREKNQTGVFMGCRVAIVGAFAA